MEISRNEGSAAGGDELVPGGRQRAEVEVLGPAAELVEGFELTLAATPTTQRTYMQSLRAFLAWLPPAAGLEGFSMKSIADYQRYMGRRKEEGGAGLALSTQRKNRAAINALLGWAEEHNLVSGEQVRLVRSIKLPQVTQEREQPDWLSGRETRALMNAARSAAAETASGEPAEVRRGQRRRAGVRDLAMVHVLLYASLRCEELVSLDVRDYEQLRGDSTLRRIHVRSGKGGRERRIRLPPASAKALTAWCEWRIGELGEPAGSDPLFCTITDGARDAGARLGRWSVVDAIERLFREAGIEGDRAHPHILRHTGATYWLSQNNWDLVALQRHLGHASPKTTAIYVHHSEEELDELYNPREPVPALVRDARERGRR